MSTKQLGLWAAERGLVPTSIVRQGIRRLLNQRLAELVDAESNSKLADTIRSSPIAVEVELANDQHYELPADFFGLVLGPHLKYSGCFWPHDDATLGEAEETALQLVCERAEIADGQTILELGCGWGSLSLFLARRYPNARIVAVSNSTSQKDFIDSFGASNLEVRTADMNTFETSEVFDRIVSVEMFEHMRNYEELLRRIAGWLKPDGRLFVHIFCHRSQTYHFETEGADNWMGRFFFSGGTMPSRNLLALFDRDLSIDATWIQNGSHYARTARAWRENLERNHHAAMRILAKAYASHASQWYHRWRIFFLSCEELFGFREGTEWMVAHYRFVKA